MKEVVIITGVSGAGKSTAMSFLEDIGYYCIDNMPPELISTFVNLIEKSDSYNKIAMVVDVRSTDVFNIFIDGVETLKKNDYKTKIIYLDIKDHIALKRYKLTRRKHPLADKFDGNISDALIYEKNILASLRQHADFVIDTSDLQANQLRTRLSQIVLDDYKNAMNINIMSFGFKHGVPTDADFVLDVRCLPNPYWIESMRNRTGLEKDIYDYVFRFKESQILYDKLVDMMEFLTPLYVKEGKSQLVIAIGCTGGNHRSVAFAQRLYEYFNSKMDNVTVNHRDIDKR